MDCTASAAGEMVVAPAEPDTSAYLRKLAGCTSADCGFVHCSKTRTRTQAGEVPLYRTTYFILPM